MGSKKLAKNNILTGKNLIITSLTLLLAISGFLNLYFLNNKSDSTNLTEVIEVVDGDTFRISNKQYIRLEGVKAPEKGMCFYDESTNYLKDLIEGKNVRLEYLELDSYNRPTAYVYVGDILVNGEMLKNGYARYSGRSESKAKGMDKDFEYARDNELGLYSTCVSEAPLDPKCTIKGNISDGRNTKIYHYKGCKNYTHTRVDIDLGEQWFCSEQEAIDAGFVKSGGCGDVIFEP